MQEIEALLSRAQVQKLLGFKSITGFNNFMKVTPDFPPVIKRTKSTNSKVYFSKTAIDDFLSRHDMPLKDEMLDNYREYCFEKIKYYLEKEKDFFDKPNAELERRFGHFEPLNPENRKEDSKYVN